MLFSICGEHITNDPLRIDSSLAALKWRFYRSKSILREVINVCGLKPNLSVIKMHLNVVKEFVKTLILEFGCGYIPQHPIAIPLVVDILLRFSSTIWSLSLNGEAHTEEKT